MVRVLVVAKAPAPGRSKTRLVPPLTPEGAAALQTALLLDTVAACRAQANDVKLLVPSSADGEQLDRLCGGVAWQQQAGRGLGEALRLGLADATPRAPVAIVSSDVPGLPAGALAETAAELRDVDVVLGPATDGGYWLIAARGPVDAAFRDIPWSTPATLAVTLRRCQDAGLRVHLLQPWRDIDTVADLATLGEDGALADAPATRAAVAGIDLTGVAGPPAPTLLGSELVLGTPWRALLVDRLRRSDGAETAYSYLAVPRAVFVVPVTAAGDVVLVRQYRHPVRDWTLEVPAGAVEEGESPLEAAARELREEAGGTSERIDHLATFYSSSAHLSLRSDAFLARDVRLGAAEPEAGEELALVRLPFAEAIRLAGRGAVTEGQTALALLLAAARAAESAG